MNGLNITIQRDDLIAALRPAASVAGKGSAVPILAHVRLEAADGRLAISATDGDLSIAEAVPLTEGSAVGWGVTTVDAARLSAVVSSLPSGEPDVRLTEAAGQRLRVRAGRSDFSLSATDGADFPPGLDVGDDVRAFSVMSADLGRAIGETLFSVCDDVNRLGLSGLYLEPVEGGTALRFVSTDGSRLSWSDCPISGAMGVGVDDGLISIGGRVLKRGRLVSRAFVAQLRRLISDGQDWRVTIGDRAISARSGGMALTGRLIDGDFPDYRMVLPTQPCAAEATVESAALVGALKRAALMATDRNSSIRCTFGEGEAVIEAQDVKAGNVREVLPCSLMGAPISTGFNATYLLDVLGAVKGREVTIAFRKPLDPVEVRASGRADCMFIVMPMRLD